MTLRILKRKQHKELVASLNAQWECELDFGDYAFVLTPKEKVFLANKEIFEVDLSSLRVNSIGMYFAEVKKELRLSIEGAQLVGPYATQNVVDLSDEQLQQWFKGDDFPFEGEFTGFVILRHNEDYVGCTKIKDGMLLNFCPKSRRL